MRFKILFIPILASLMVACNSNKKDNPANNSNTNKDTTVVVQDTSTLFGSTTDQNAGGKELTVEERARRERVAHYTKVYKEALKVGDPYTQLIATYNLMADDTSKERPYIDTLSSLYARLNMAGPATKMANRVLAIDPSNRSALEIKAGGSLGMGNAKDAMATNRKLYSQTKDVKYLFAIAEMQFDAQDLKGLNQTVKQIEGVPNLEKQKLDMQTDQPGKMQKIPASAALEYLKGLIALGKNELAMAQLHLNKAVRISPNFVLAQRYLDAMLHQQKTP